MFTLQLIVALLSQSAIIAAVPVNSIIHARDNLDVILDALTPVSQSLAQVDAAVLALDGGPVTANNLLVVTQQAQVTTDQATLQIQASGDVTGFRAARLRRTTDALIDQTTTTVSDLVSRKPILDNLGASGVALESLQRQKISTMALSAALSDKVPRIGQRIAEDDRIQLENVLDQGISAYSQPAVAAVPVAVIPAAPPAAVPAVPAAAPPAAVPAVPAAAPPAAVPAVPAVAPPAAVPAAAPPAAVPAAPPAAAAPAPPAAAVPADPAAAAPAEPAAEQPAAGWPDQQPAAAAPAPPASAPQAGTPAAAPAPAVGAPAPAPAVPVAVVPAPIAPPPQVTPPAGRKDRKKKKANRLEVEPQVVAVKA